MAEGLPRLEHLNHLALVDQIHRAGEDHPQSRGRRSVLDQDRLARLERLLSRGLDQGRDLLRGQAIKRRLPGEKCVQVLHVEPRNCVGIAPVTRPAQVGA
jgi:hypothetical protein